MEKLTGRITIALKILGATQILSGLGASLAIFLLVSPETLGIVGEEIVMSGQAVRLAALLVMSSVISTGVVSVLRVPWGWIFSFTVAAFVLVMGLLMGPGTIPITKWSFLGLMLLSLVNWTAAVVYYYHDLYS